MSQIKSLEDVLKELHTVSGFRMSLYDAAGHPLCAYPKERNPFCRLIQENEAALACCRKSDQEAFERARRTGEVYIYRCHCELYEAVVPLYHFGTFSGYLMMGQVLDTSRISRQTVLFRAQAYGAEKTAILKAVRGIPLRTMEQIHSCISIVEICAGYLSLSSYLNADKRDLAGNVRSYVRLHYGEPLNLDLLCREFYCSRATLTSAFRKTYGQSIVEYLTQVRMEAGMELLTKTDRKIGEIAGMCGYPDQNYFTRRFRKHFGIPPGRARQEA